MHSLYIQYSHIYRKMYLYIHRNTDDDLKSVPVSTDVPRAQPARPSYSISLFEQLMGSIIARMSSISIPAHILNIKRPDAQRAGGIPSITAR